MTDHAALLRRVQVLYRTLQSLRAGVRPKPDPALWAAFKAAEASLEALRNLLGRRISLDRATERGDRRYGP